VASAFAVGLQKKALLRLSEGRQHRIQGESRETVQEIFSIFFAYGQGRASVGVSGAPRHPTIPVAPYTLQP